MSFRTIVIKNRCKLEYSLNYLIYKADEEKHICLDEISMIIIENQQCAITCVLLSKLVEKKIKVIFCDGKHDPQFELTPYYANYENYSRIIEQTQIDKVKKDTVWTQIIKEKINNQSLLLNNMNFQKEYLLLQSYIEEINIGDPSNREGHAAKVYFNSLFGNSFSRDKECEENIFMNYGYSILISLINMEIKKTGYLTELGIHHIGATNKFNLSYDLIEPLRTLIDTYIVKKKIDITNYKITFQGLNNITVKYDNKDMHLEDALYYYVRNVFKCLKSNDYVMNFIKYEI